MIEEDCNTTFDNSYTVIYILYAQHHCFEFRIKYSCKRFYDFGNNKLVYLFMFFLCFILNRTIYTFITYRYWINQLLLFRKKYLFKISSDLKTYENNNKSMQTRKYSIYPQSPSTRSASLDKEQTSYKLAHFKYRYIGSLSGGKSTEVRGQPQKQAFITLYQWVQGSRHLHILYYPHSQSRPRRIGGHFCFNFFFVLTLYLPV